MPYYISSTNYTVYEAQLQKGKVFGTVIRVMRLDGKTIQKRFSGYKTKALLASAVGDFIATECQVVSRAALKSLTVRSKPTKEIITVGDLFAQYITSLQNQNKETTIYDKEKTFRLYVLPQIGNIPIEELDREHLLQWQDNFWKTRRANGEFLSYKYLTKVRGFLCSFLNWVQDRYQYINHLAKIPIPKRQSPKKEMNFWTREQFDTFLAAVDNPTYKTLFATLFFTGRRKGEVLALTPEDVSLSTIKFTKSVAERTTDGSAFKVTTTKADKIYSSPVCAPLAKILAAYTPQSPFYFSGDRPIPPETLRRKFLDYTTKAGLPPIRIHDLRHSFVSMIIHLGATLPVVADLIGDTLEQVTKTYAHVYEDDKRAVIESIK